MGIEFDLSIVSRHKLHYKVGDIHVLILNEVCFWRVVVVTRENLYSWKLLVILVIVDRNFMMGVTCILPNVINKWLIHVLGQPLLD